MADQSSTPEVYILEACAFSTKPHCQNKDTTPQTKLKCPVLKIIVFKVDKLFLLSDTLVLSRAVTLIKRNRKWDVKGYSSSEA
jgi:hypothetical protein